MADPHQRGSLSCPALAEPKPQAFRKVLKVGRKRQAGALDGSDQRVKALERHRRARSTMNVNGIRRIPYRFIFRTFGIDGFF
jgi:hypothetical protein